MAESAGEEREYNVPLRQEWLKVASYKRAKKAVTALRQFLVKHMKADDVGNIHIGAFLNKEIWKHGIKNPPHHVKIKTRKFGDGTVVAELSGKALPDIEKKKEEEKGKVESVLEKMAEKTGLKKEEKLIVKKEKKDETEKKIEEAQEEMKEKKEEQQEKAEKEIKELPKEEKTAPIEEQQKGAEPKKEEASTQKEAAGKKEVL